ncbi:MAG: bile acid:sodium symporter, partial [Spirochaetaceae bacterium]|nr:bile acid:sodium symporter [Spirochaetaceae bacterium]
MTKIFYFIKRNWFLLGIFIAVLIGYYFPSAVTRINRNGYLITLLVIAVFFIQGLTIEKEKLLNGLKNIKLHIFIFFFTFIFYPLYFYIAVKLFPFLNHNEAIVAGMFALACLPTTILVSSVFVNNAGGNTSITVLNVVLSNIIGVFIAPIILSLLLNRSTLALPLSMVLGILKSLVIRIIIPMGLGMAIRKFAVKIID